MRKLRVIALVLMMFAGTANAHTCLLIDNLQLDEWQPGQGSVFPNSICIFPDGRTGVADAVAGSIELVFALLSYRPYAWDTGCQLDWLGRGLDFNANGGNVVLCGGGDYYAPCEFLPCNLAAFSIFGGGHSAVDGAGNPVGKVEVVWSPPNCDSGCGPVTIDLYINSPDINGDLVVNNSDAGIFTQDMYGAYNYRSDFNFDGVVNMSDAGIFSAALSATCGP